MKDGTVRKFERSIATKEATEVDAPVPVIVHPKRRQLVVGQMGEISLPGDSLVNFYSLKGGKLTSTFETELHDLTGLAFSPKGGLYATDFAWFDTSEGGLFRIVTRRKDGEPVGGAKKIASLDKPTACVFAEDGTLYVTVIGTPAEGSDAPSGQLLKFAPGCKARIRSTRFENVNQTPHRPHPLSVRRFPFRQPQRDQRILCFRLVGPPAQGVLIRSATVADRDTTGH